MSSLYVREFNLKGQKTEKIFFIFDIKDINYSIGHYYVLNSISQYFSYVLRMLPHSGFFCFYRANRTYSLSFGD